jgi:hypothetical protein
MAEQQKEAEAAKTRELAKQIQQEREAEEMDRISGKKRTMDRGIDWMYQGGAANELAKEDAEKHAEEFLLGKEFVGAGATQGDFDGGDEQQGINSVIPTAAAEASVPKAEEEDRFMEPSVKDRNESFRLRVEDPMFQVSQRQHEKEVKHEKTKALYERVVGPIDAKDSAEDLECERKTKKRKKHHKKKHHDSHSGSRRRRHRSRSRSASRDRHEKHRKKSRSYSRSCSPSEESRRGHRHDKRHQYEKNRRSDRIDSDESSYDRHRGPRRQDRDKSNYGRHDEHRSKRHETSRHDDSRSKRHDSGRHNESNDEHQSARHDGSSRHDESRRYNDHGNHRKSRDDDDDMRNVARKPDAYGLKGTGASSSININKNDLGPRRELLQQKRDEREVERRRIRDRASTRQRKSGAERAQALEEMQRHAKVRDGARKDQDSYHQKHADEDGPSRGNASFLTDMTRRTHGISGEGSTSLSARVAQNRHTNQRLHDSFL